MRDTVTIEEPKVARFFFASPAAAPIWLVARLWLGYQWLHAGWEKITGTDGGWHWAFTSQSWLKTSAGLKGFAGYALTNAKEYFAELSEAYFGRNDFYPFTRKELEKHDPAGYRLMRETWGNPWE